MDIDVQKVRLLDVFVIGPFLMYSATYKQLPNWVRSGLFIVGVGTIIYNGKNYLKNEPSAR